jgi:hypothetical protein
MATLFAKLTIVWKLSGFGILGCRVDSVVSLLYNGERKLGMAG